jgi:hypothetical protein
LFAVEQTSSGFRKLENIDIPFPVINVARSDIKLIQESPVIARLCFERINEYFTKEKIIHPFILVVGLGPIGEAVLEIFKQNNFIVDGFDIKHGHRDLLSLIHTKKPDVIIGATGSPILSVEDIEGGIFNKKLHLISVSSSDREFPVVHFRKNTDIHTNVQYKSITFVNNGFPITFKGNRLECTPVEMEKTMCLLGGSVVDTIVNGVTGKGLLNVSNQLKEILSEITIKKNLNR